MKNADIRLSNVTVNRGGRTILRITDTRFLAGEFVGIIGTNGAGKTTLLKLCCTLIRANSGTVQFDGRDITALNGWQKSNLCKQIGYIPQSAEYNANIPFTLREVVMMGRTGVKPLLARVTRQDHDQVDYWIDRLGLTGRGGQTFRTLSGGEQQKALIARAMAAEPALLLLDEPGANLDFNWKKQLVGILDSLYTQTGITILMVSHETSLLPGSCRRVLLLCQGEITADGPIEEIMNSQAMAQAYQCDVKVVEIDGQWHAVSTRDSCKH